MTPTVVQGLALAWLATLTVIITASIPVGLTLIGALRAWRRALEPKVEKLQTAAAQHEVKLNGLMTGKIAAGAAAVVAVHEAGLLRTGASPTDVAAAKAAHVAALQAELAALNTQS